MQYVQILSLTKVKITVRFGFWIAGKVKARFRFKG